MYISKLVFDRTALARRGMYEAHQALWDVFSDSPDRKRDFLYRQMDQGAFLAVSRREPAPGPDLSQRDVQPYTPALRTGERVLFSLRVNPVRKTRDDKGRQVRHDVVQDLRKRLMADGTPEHKLPTRLELAEQAATSWLEARQGALGLALEAGSLMAEAYENRRFRKARGGPEVVVSSLDLRGFAHVTDPEALGQALFDGIGPAKAYGCGLLLVRRG